MKIYRPKSIFDVTHEIYVDSFRRAMTKRIDFKIGKVTIEPAKSTSGEIAEAIEHMAAFRLEDE